MKDMLKFLDEKAKLLSIAFDLDLRVPSASTLRWIQMVLNPMHISLTLYSLTTRSHPGIVLNSPILVFDGKTLYGAFDLKRKKHSPGLLSVYIHNLGTTLTANPCGKDGLEIETLLKAL